MMQASNPLIVQSDRSLMLHTVRSLVDASGRPVKDEQGRPLTEEHPRFAEARDQLALFAELEKSPDYLHTYRITPISIWNAAAIGHDRRAHRRRSSRSSPACPCRATCCRRCASGSGATACCASSASRAGRALRARLGAIPTRWRDVLGHEAIRKLVVRERGARLPDAAMSRGTIKQALIKIGYPVDDRGGYLEGDQLPIELRKDSRSGRPFGLRAYQSNAAEAFHAGGSVRGRQRRRSCCPAVPARPSSRWA